MAKSKQKKTKANSFTWQANERVSVNCDSSSYWGVLMPQGTILRIVGNHIGTHGGYVLVTDGECSYLLFHGHLTHHKAEALDAA